VAQWMQQVARNLTEAEGGALLGQRHLVHDRDMKFCAGFRSILRNGDVEPLRLRPSSPDLNASAESWRALAKKECLSKLILFGEASLRRALSEYLARFQAGRPHRGKENVACLRPEAVVSVHQSQPDAWIIRHVTAPRFRSVEEISQATRSKPDERLVPQPLKRSRNVATPRATSHSSSKTVQDHERKGC